MHLAMNPDSLEPPVIAAGKKVILRDRLPSDVESALRWRTTGEWRFFDAPWEGVETSLRSEQEAVFRQHFKVGFLYEGAQRQMIQWQGEWLDLIHFGMPRSEWKA